MNEAGQSHAEVTRRSAGRSHAEVSRRSAGRSHADELRFQGGAVPGWRPTGLEVVHGPQFKTAESNS